MAKRIERRRGQQNHQDENHFTRRVVKNRRPRHLGPHHKPNRHVLIHRPNNKTMRDPDREVPHLPAQERQNIDGGY